MPSRAGQLVKRKLTAILVYGLSATAFFFWDSNDGRNITSPFKTRIDFELGTKIGENQFGYPVRPIQTFP